MNSKANGWVEVIRWPSRIVYAPLARSQALALTNWKHALFAQAEGAQREFAAPKFTNTCFQPSVNLEPAVHTRGATLSLFYPENSHPQPVLLEAVCGSSAKIF